ncbi:MAG: DUF3014 domain-containing protein [Wenzhouxiangellaceae bacterium]|nr:DUF3014 domain-containing protein [Wenzhouxiangellaceae bacterium]
MSQLPHRVVPFRAAGRIGWIAMVVLVLVALALYLFSERAVPPEPEAEPPEPVPAEPADAEAESEPAEPGDESDGDAAGLREPPPGSQFSTPGPVESPPQEIVEREPAPIDLERAAEQVRAELGRALAPEQLQLVVEERLLQRLVATLNSLDGDPIPLRFRPVEHVPGLPRVAGEGDELRLPDAFDPRYRPYREMFERLDVEQLAALFERHESALEQAWQAMGEEHDQSFRERTVDVLRHLARFDVPDERPELVQPEVLYEYADPQLESLSWGRKILIRIGPEQAREVQRKLDALADRLAREG